MAPDEGLALFTELAKARQCFVLETELHLIYLVTPYSACHSWGTIDWMFYLDLWEKLPPTMKRVGELVGIKESYIVNATRGKIQTNTNKLYHKLMVHKRFFVALALQDLVNEKPLGWVCAKFNCNRGMLQSLQQSASSFAGMVTSFSRQLGWGSVDLLISQFQDRLQFGISRDLLDLMRLPILNGKMARTLFNADIQTIAHLANSTISKIENILHRDKPFESEKEREGETEFEKNQRNKFRNVWIQGKDGLTEVEAAEMLVNEAREYLKREMGLAEAKWETSLNDSQKTIENNEELLEQHKCVELNNKEMCRQSDVEELNDDEQKSVIISNSSGTNDSTKIEDFDENNSSKLPELPMKKTKTPQKYEVSNLLISPSSIELNISKSPMISSRGSLSISLEKMQSDESLFDESFTLKLSESDKDSSADTKKLSCGFPSASFLENAFSGTFNETKDISAKSEDIFDTSIKKQSPDRNKKRRMSNFEHESKTPSKKQKINNEINFSYCLNKFNEDSDENVDFSKIEIVDVCAESSLFDMFAKEIEKQKCIALSLACTKFEENVPTIGIKRKNEKADELFTRNNRKLNGFSISLGSNVAVYLSLNDANYQIKVIHLIERLLKNKQLKVKLFDCKEQLKVLKYCAGVNFYAELDDPKVADWILDPEGKEKNLQAMVSKYFFI